MTRYTAIALVSCFAAACGAQATDQSSGGGGGGPSPGFGGGGGVKSVVSLEDFGYGTEAEGSLGIQGSTGAGTSNFVATICGDVDIYGSELLEAEPPRANSYASATRAREMIASKQAPISSSLRSDDHSSYFRAGAIEAGLDALVASMAMRQLQIAGQLIPKRYLLWVGVQAGQLTKRPPVALTVVVDTTPSMAGEPLARARASLRALADALSAGDHLTVLDTESQLRFDQTLVDPATDTSGLEQELAVGADVPLAPAVQSALDHAASLAASPQWNQVVLLSDGQGDPDTLPLDQIAEAAKAGVRVSSVGVGGSYVMGDALLYRASQAGRGSYVYVDGVDEPERMLRQRFDELFGVAFDEVKVTVSLPWFLSSVDQAKPSATDAAPRSISPNGTLSFVYNLQSCHESAFLKYGAQYQLTVNVAFKKPDGLTGSYTGGSFAADYLNTSAAGLDAVLATRAYVAALRAPTKDRFSDAFARLEPLRQPGNAFEEMWNLLDAYPKKP